MSEAPLKVYCILEPLGGPGGLPVWRAEDPGLGRHVVLQFLDGYDEAALDLARREALAASSINHLNICRVYEISELAGRPFLAREYLEGESLRLHGGGRPLSYGHVLEIGMQIANALHAVHSVALVHRHLSPVNVFISTQGHVTVAGFGVVPSAGSSGTDVCVAPEQAAGQGADARSDLFSLAAILYELATGVPPASSGAPPPSQLVPGLPAAFDALIHYTLDPDPDARYQSAEGMSRALTLLKRGLGNLENIERLRRVGAQGRKRRRIRRSTLRWRRRGRRVLWLAGLALLGAVAWTIYTILPHPRPYSRIAVEGIAPAGAVRDAAISPDGKSFAEVRPSGSYQSIWLRPSGGSARRLTDPAETKLWDLAFSGDGQSVLYVSGEPASASLYQVPVRGGRSRKILTNVLTAAFTPDGYEAAYIRGGQSEVSVFTGKFDDDLSLLTERVLVSHAYPQVPQALAWSRDRRWLAIAYHAQGSGSRLYLADPRNGALSDLGWHLWQGRLSLAWLPGGDAIMVSGAEAGGISPLWRVSVPDGETTRITSTLDSYSHISLSADGRRLAAVQSDYVSNVWLVPGGEAAAARQLTTGARPDGVGGMAWTPGGRIVFGSRDGSRRGLWTVAADGGDFKPLITGTETVGTPVATPDGKSILFLSYNGGSARIWAVDADGRNARPVTFGGAEFMPSLSPDGSSLYFTSGLPGAAGVWRLPLTEGQAAEHITRSRATFAVVSPDGKLLAYRTTLPDGSDEVIIVPSGGGPPVARLRIPEFTQIAWTEASDAIMWARTEGGAGNLWAQPIAGGLPRQFTHFTSLELFSFAWSRDHSRLATARGYSATSAVLIRDIR
jgi:Tol biopolymer transport system component